MQDRLQAQRRQLVTSSLGEYALQFEPFIPAGLLAELSGTLRERHFGNTNTFWAWLSQVMDANASCSSAVSLVQAWCAEAGLPIPSSQTGAYCKARQRLPMSLLEGVLHHLGAMMRRRVQPADLWRGHVLKAIDGSSLRLLDTAANQEAYPQPCAQKPGCGFPVMGILGVCNLSHGGWEAFANAPATEHDPSLASHLLEQFGEGDLVLVTTLTEAQQCDGADLAVKTPAMAHKSLAMLMIGYNLVKALSQQAAHQAGRAVGDLGFKGVLDLVAAYRGNYRGHRRHEHKRAALHQSLLEIIASKLIMERPGRREPRAVKRRPIPFPLLISPRHSYQEIHHRSRYRAAA